MKSQPASARIGVIDALTAGLAQAARRPGLVAIPALVDLGLWLAPRLSVKELVQRGGLLLEGLSRAGYVNMQPEAFEELLVLFREGIQQLSTSVNLANAIGGHWLALPSTLMRFQANRYTLFSDGILAPVGIGVKVLPVSASPWQGAPVEIRGVGLALLTVVGLWLLGHLLSALYLRFAAAMWPGRAEGEAPAARWRGLRGLLALTLHLVLLNMLIGVGVGVLFAPLVMAMNIAAFVGGAVAQLAFAAAGGITLWLVVWFLTSVFFTSEALLVDGSSLLSALWQSTILVRNNGVPTLGLLIVINLIMLGFRAAWGLLGQTPLAVLAAIAGNAYLATGILLAVFVYYDGLRKRWVSVRKTPSAPTGQS